MARVITARPDDAFQALGERLATISDVNSAAQYLRYLEAKFGGLNTIREE